MQNFDEKIRDLVPGIIRQKRILKGGKLQRIPVYRIPCSFFLPPRLFLPPRDALIQRRRHQAEDDDAHHQHIHFEHLGSVDDQISQAGPGEPFLTEEDLDFLHRLSEHLQANFFAAKIADRRQKDLLNLASFPEILHKYNTGTDLLQNIIADLHSRIDFDFGICYRFDAAENILRPVI